MPGRLAYIRLVFNGVKSLGGSALELCGYGRENLVGFADHNMVGLGKQVFRLAPGVRTSDHRSPTKLPRREESFTNVIPLDSHSAKQDEVGPQDVTVLEVLEAAID